MSETPTLCDSTQGPSHISSRRTFVGRAFAAVASVGFEASGDTQYKLTGRSVTSRTCSIAPHPLLDVQHKVAFITGGDSGIGLGIARAFVETGMKVAITYRSAKHLAEAMASFGHKSHDVHPIAVDVTDRDAMFAAAEEVIQVFGKVHVLVNNAGVDIGLIPLVRTTFDDWDWVIGVNVNAVFYGVRAFLPHITEHGEGGHIVSTSSIQGLIARNGGGLYSTTRFAVVGMMEALRWELKNTNVGVSVFCPGFVVSNIGDAARNRPHASGTGTIAPADSSPLSAERSRQIDELVKRNGGRDPSMESLEAGRRVLKGIRNNDLYILSHAEFEQAIRDRNEAILASLPKGEPPPPEARVEMERLWDMLGNPIYAEQYERGHCVRSAL